jgi:hypothetical protein
MTTATSRPATDSAASQRAVPDIAAAEASASGAWARAAPER